MHTDRRAAWRGIAIVSALVLVCTGCVTETVSPARPAPVQGPTATGRSSSPMPTQPVATPARDARTVNAILRAAITPLGTIPFDGQVLPMISPDGRFAATQVGQTPSWSAMLVEPDAPPSPRTNVEVYDISSQPVRLVREGFDLPPGTMLGRSCDESGFLVEHITPMGERRVGNVSWRGGDVEWFEGGTATLVEQGIVATTAEQALKTPWGEVREPGSEMWFPVSSGERGLVYCFAASHRGLELQAWSRSVRATSEGMSADSSMSIIARRRIAPRAERILAYQAVDPVRGWMGAGSEEPPGLLFFNPGTRRMTVFDANTGDLVPLAAESISGVWTRDAAGWGVLLSTSRGLVYQRLEESRSAWTASPEARLLGEPYVPRATMDPTRPSILIGPARDARRVNLVALQLMPSDLEE
ncbi:MAG: hypothetical protein EA380_03105 [Phycisphaeraceae bacterium]|nr:MAG: hypothetical protein EA380_03105 [Phycisphaeraceae bacterium]